MKKLIAIALSICLLATLAVVFVGCNDEEYTPDPVAKAYKANDNIVAETYDDYASNAKLNTEKYPWIAERGQGLFWAAGYDDDGDIIEVKADTAEGARAFDTTKPTILITHGVQFANGRNGNQDFCWSSSLYSDQLPENYNFDQVFSAEDMPSESDFRLDLSQIYYNLGYNVGMFHYEIFCDSESTDLGGIGSFGLDFGGSENNILRPGAIAMNLDGSYTDADAIGKYNLTEFYVGEYLRATSLISGYDASKEVIFSCHSMGGFITGLFSHLVTEMVRVGKLNAAFMPDRVNLLDPYMGIGSMATDNESLIAWTGKKLIDGSSRHVYFACLENLVMQYDIAVEFFCLTSHAVPYMVVMHEGTKEKYPDNGLDFMKAISCWVEIATDYGYSMPAFEGHNAVRESYMLSRAADKQLFSLENGKPVTEDNMPPTNKQIYLPSAALSLEESRALRGCKFSMNVAAADSDNAGGSRTIYTTDDTYTISTGNFENFTPVYGTIE